MKKNMGVWIDSERAYVIAIQGNKSSVTELTSSIESRVRIPGEGKEFGRFGDQYLSDEQSKERRRQDEVKRFVNQIIDKLKEMDNLVIFGPSGMKIELQKGIKNQYDLKDKLSDVLSADSMTKNQVVAWVKSYYKEKE